MIRNIILRSGITGPLTYVLQMVRGRISKSGTNNKIFYAGTSIFWNTKIKLKGKNNTVRIGREASLKNLKITVVGNDCTVTIGDKVKFYERGQILLEGERAFIKVGDKTTFGDAKLFAGESDTGISIGTDCMFSREISVHTSDFHSIINKGDNERINPPRSITIGDHVWIGEGAFIAKGSRIGSGSVVGYLSYVNGKTFGENMVIAGIPAKARKDNVSWSRDKLPYKKTEI